MDIPKMRVYITEIHNNFTWRILCVSVQSLHSSLTKSPDYISRSYFGLHMLSPPSLIQYLTNSKIMAIPPINASPKGLLEAINLITVQMRQL